MSGLVSTQQRVSAVLQFLRYVEAAASQFALAVVLCGLELNALKKQVGHGQWEAFFAANLARKKFSLDTAQRYMRAGEAMKSKTANLRFLDVPPSAMTEEQISGISAEVGRLTDAATWGELMADLGFAKRPAGSGVTGGYRPDPAKLAEFLGAYHADLVGTEYGALPAEVQAHFRKWVAQREQDPAQMAFDFCAPALDVFEHPEFDHALLAMPEADAHRMLDHAEAIVRRLRERFGKTQRKAA